MSIYLITGASKGIGFEIVKSLLHKGKSVVAISRNVEALKLLQEQTDTNRLHVLSVDLAKSSAIEALIDKLPELDGVVNNAGLLNVSGFGEASDEEWHDQIEVNLMAPVRLLRGLKNSSKLKNPSHVINISSMGGFQGSAKFAGLSAYSATKGALSILSECLATEWLNDGVSVNALCLGAVQTEMLSKAFPGYQAPITAEQMGGFIAHFLIYSGALMSGKILPIAGQDPS